MKTVLVLLNTDHFAMPLIDYLVDEGKRYSWRIVVGSMFDQELFNRMKSGLHSDVSCVHIKDQKQCDREIRKADLVIGLVPDVMLLNVVDACIARSKRLISPARLNRQLYAKRSQAEENDALILVECGFTPGLDHITAKKMIDQIHAKGGKISSFTTSSGSLADESCIDNPWDFKLTSPSHEILNFGKGQNRYLIDGQLQHVPYHQLFMRETPFPIQGLNNTVMVPEEDGLYCQRIYDLAEADTVMKGRILRKGFASVWSLVVRLGMTNATHRLEMPGERSFKSFLRSLVPHSQTESLEDLLHKYMSASEEDIGKIKWLGLFDDAWFEGTQELTPAILLQSLLEKKLYMSEDDKDCIVIRHDLEYSLNNYNYKFNATLLTRGEDLRHSALAKAIGLTTGAAAKAVLVDNIRLTGIHTPVKKEIYDPVLNELEDLGIAFTVEEKRTREEVSVGTV